MKISNLTKLSVVLRSVLNPDWNRNTGLLLIILSSVFSCTAVSSEPRLEPQYRSFINHSISVFSCTAVSSEPRLEPRYRSFINHSLKCFQLYCGQF